MKLQDILTIKGSKVYTITPEATLQDVVRTLVEHRIGALIVCLASAEGKEELLGIVTERDILYACTVGSKPLDEVSVSEAMSRGILTAKPDDEVEAVMGLMTTRRIRHLPVLCDGRLAGIISIGDVVKAQHDRLAMENRFMKDYIGSQR
jgi:CBS domain-containing protein